MSELRDAFVASKLLASGSKSASITGEVVEFDASKSAPLSKLSVALSPIQDLHGYDAPWPAGGGKNLYPIQIGEDSFVNNGSATHSNSNGALVIVTSAESGASGVYVGSGNHIQSILNAVSAPLTVSMDIVATASGTVRIVFCGKKLTFTIGTTKQRISVTALSTSTPNFNIYGVNNGATLTVSNLQIEQSATVSDYAPYSNICPISGHDSVSVWVQPTHDTSADPTAELTFPTPPGTVYGGTVDLVSGVLTVNRAIVDLGSLRWGGSSTNLSGVYRYATIDPIPIVIAPSGGTKPNMVCSQFSAVTPNQTYARVEGVSNNINKGQIIVFDPLYTDGDAAAFKTAMSGVQLVYELDEPLTYQLTPTQIDALKGSNVIWSDGGPVTVEYSAESVPRGEWPVIIHRLFDVDYPLAVLFSKED